MNNVVEFEKTKKYDLSTYRKLLRLLRKKEQDMGLTPLLKDWFHIRNQIRYVERKIKIKELSNGKN